MCLLSYNMNRIISFLDVIRGINYTLLNPVSGYYTGCRVKFPNTDIEMSVQTHHIFEDDNYFVQTALLNREGILVIPSYKYEYVSISHRELEGFIDHFNTIIDNVNGKNAVDIEDALVVNLDGTLTRPTPPSPPPSIIMEEDNTLT